MSDQFLVSVVCGGHILTVQLKLVHPVGDVETVVTMDINAAKTLLTDLQTAVRMIERG